MGTLSSDLYFAALEAYSPQFLDACLEKVRIYRNFCETTGKASKWQRLLQNYYGVSSDGTKSSSMVTQGGDAGQWTMAKVNDFRNLIQHQLILVTANRPAGQAKAINSDTRSIHQARIGSLLTEYYLSQVGWEQKFLKAAELALVADEGFLALDWDQTLGDPVRPNPETGRMIMTGDSTLRAIPAWNMARDPYIQSPDDMKWGIYSYRVNKFDLAAKFPNAEADILNASNRGIKGIVFDEMEFDKTDQVTVYVLVHDLTPACPQGRYAMFVPDAILMDGEFPYSEFNLYRMSQNDVLETSFGYTNNNDLLALEEVTDALHSILISNNVNFGGQAIIAPKGSGLAHTQLAKGFAFFEVDPAMVDKIKPLQLTRSAPETYNYLETLSRKKETLAGINSVVRGDPEGALRSSSGSALALVQAQSLQFNSGGQRSYYHVLSKANTGHIKLLQRYAKNKRVARIAGKNQSQYLEEFYYNGKDLEHISSVVFEAVDAAFQTIGGKIAVADNLLAKDMIKNARQYINVVRTGSLDIFTEDDEADELGYKSENERLREGQPVKVVTVENHERHIKSHMSVIASPESKEDVQLVMATLEHIQEHMQIWQQLSLQNPALLIATGQKVLPPPPPPPGMGPPPGMPPPPGLPPGGAPPPHPGPPQGPSGPAPHARTAGPDTTQTIMNGRPPVETKAGEVRQPGMPTNPATGQKAPPPMQA